MSIEVIGNREETNVHAELFGIFSRMKKELVALKHLDGNSYKQIITVIVIYRQILENFYFEHTESLGDIFTEKIISDDDVKKGEYANIMHLLRKDHANRYGKLFLEEIDVDALDKAYITLLHGQTSTTDNLHNIISSEKAELLYPLREFFRFYLSQILWEISNIEQTSETSKIIEDSGLRLGNTLKLLSFDVENKNTHDPEQSAKSFETVDTIFPHVYVRDPAYQANLFLGYDIAQKRIQTIQEKNAIKKAIEEGDESQRLQVPENGQTSSLPAHMTSLQVLTKDALPQKELIYQRVLALWDGNGWLFGHTEGVQTDPAAQTVAEKRGRKQFLKQVAYVEEKMQGLPEGIAVKEIDTIIFRLLHPLYKKKRDTQNRTPFYLPSSGKKTNARMFSDSLIRKYGAVVGEIDFNHRGARKPSKMYERKYESIKQFYDAQRKEKITEREGLTQDIFQDDLPFTKRMNGAYMHAGYSEGEARKESMIQYLCFINNMSNKRDKIEAFITNYLDSIELFREIRKDLIANVDKVDRPQILREIQQEVQAERNEKFVHDEKTIQRIYYAIIHQAIYNAGIVRSGDRKHQQATFESLNLLHEVFTNMLVTDGIDTRCLDKAYQQVYMHYRATGIDGYGIQDILAHIKKKLSPNLKIDIEDMTKVLQRNYDEYTRNKTYVPGQEYRGEHYEELADIFGVKLTLRKKKMMEDLLIEQMHTPHKIQAIDYIGESYARRSGMQERTINDTKTYLQESGSLMLPENARAQDIREINDIAPDQWVDLDSIVPIGESIPKLHFQSHANRTKKGIMEGNYVLWYNTQAGMLELVYDTTLRTHHDIMEQYSIQPSSILGGGYATINKGLQEILLESYMPTFLHEPRIISVVAFKNAFKELLPNAKIVIGEDGMQNIEHHFERESTNKDNRQTTTDSENPDDLPF